MAPVKHRGSYTDDTLLPALNGRKSLKVLNKPTGFIQRSGASDNAQSLAIQVKRRASVASQKLAVPGNSNSKHHGSLTTKRRSGSIASGSSDGDSGGSHDDGSDSRVRRRHRHKKSKKDNIFTRFREYIAESDVFIAKDERAPFVTCIYITLFAIPIFTVTLIWDTLAVAHFQIPHLSTINHPAFVLEFQFISILLAMYGYCVQMIMFYRDRNVSLAKISLCCHSVLFLWRIFLEIYYDGYRSESKHYIPRTD